MAAFAGDARLPRHEHEVLRWSAAARIAVGGLFVVYTPPELRGRGYASACVAGVSKRALASGKRFCTLYTDLANPTSNSIYQRVGYVRIGESAMVAFAD